MPIIHSLHRSLFGWRFIWSLACLVFFVFMLPGVASAHARLVTAEPKPDSSFTTPPSAIRIYFTEAVSLSFCAVQLLDHDGNPVPLAPLMEGSTGASSLVAPIAKPLPPGTYGVEWRAVSAVDGHLTTGSFVFRVLAQGEAAGGQLSPIAGIASAQAGASSSFDAVMATRWVLRVIILTCLSFCLGGSLFLVFVVKPVATEEGMASRPLLLTLSAHYGFGALFAGALLIPCLALDLLLQVATIEQSSVSGAIASGAAARLLLGTTLYGASWLGQMVTALLLLLSLLSGALEHRQPASVSWKASATGGALFALANAISSHPSASQGAVVGGVPLAALSDWLHILAAATWIGGVVFFATLLFPRLQSAAVPSEEKRHILGALVPRFSRLAIVSTSALGVTGVVNIAVESTDVSSILSSTYGQVVAIKVSLFIVLIALGAANLLRLSPKLTLNIQTSADQKLSQAVLRLGRNVRMEASLMVVILVAAGLLSLVPPPVATNAGPATTSATTTAIQAPSLLAATNIEGYNLVLRVEPSELGDLLDIQVTQTTSNAFKLDDISQEIIKITQISQQSGGTSVDAKPLGNQAGDSQEWSTIVAPAILTGTQQISVLVERRQHADIKAAFLLSSATTGIGSDPARQGGDAILTAIPYIEVNVDTEPAPPTVGRCRLTFSLSNGQGSVIASATTLQVYASQPLGNAEPLLAIATPVNGSSGTYDVTLDLPASGGWLLNILVKSGDTTVWETTASFDVAGTVPLKTP